MLHITIVSDFVCPWCYIGYHRLKNALAALGHSAMLTFHPFLLSPQLPPEGISRQDYVDGKFGDQAQNFYARITATAADDGLTIHFDRVTQQPNTFDLHRLVLAVQQTSPELAQSLVLRFFEGFFIDGINLSDFETVAALYTDIGGTQQQALRILQNDEFAKDVQQALMLSDQYGITGVPFFIVDDGEGTPRGIPGAITQLAWERLLCA